MPYVCCSFFNMLVRQIAYKRRRLLNSKAEWPKKTKIKGVRLNAIVPYGREQVGGGGAHAFLTFKNRAFYIYVFPRKKLGDRL
jgi:hypothetical protein